jgi:hypothetical protein
MFGKNRTEAASSWRLKWSHRHRPVGSRTTRVSRVDLVTQTALFDLADGSGHAAQ